MTGTTVEVAALTRGAHACAMFDNEFEQEALLTDFVRNGLRSGCKVLCVADARSTTSPAT